MYNESILHLNECLRIDPNFSLAIETKLACYIFLNDVSKFENFIAVKPQLNYPEICKALFSLINKKQLKRPIDIATIDIDESFKYIYPWHFYLLIHYGNTEKALDVFEDKMKLKVGQLVNFQLDPFLDSLRENKRFQLITKQIISSESFSEHKEVINKDEREILKPFNDSEIKEYKLILENFIKKSKPFLNPNLSLKELGESIDLHPNKLSWLLNTEFNKNFNDFINYFRLNHFKTIALDPKNSHLTILGLAYDSGFNSKSVFNTFFKKAEGITPSKWVQQHSQ